MLVLISLRSERQCLSRVGWMRIFSSRVKSFGENSRFKVHPSGEVVTAMLLQGEFLA